MRVPRLLCGDCEREFILGKSVRFRAFLGIRWSHARNVSPQIATVGVERRQA